MALTLRLDLNQATMGDVEALLAAARAGGVASSARVALDGSQLVIDTDNPGTSVPPRIAGSSTHDNGGDTNFGQVGDAAIRTVIDILSGRQKPQGQ